MLLEALLHNPWLTPTIWVCLYCAEKILYIINIRLYRNGARRHLIFQDYELNPLYRRDSSTFKLITPWFFIFLFISTAILLTFAQNN